MVASEKVDLEMRLTLRLKWAMIAYIVYTLGLYVSDFVWKITSALDFCSFRGFGFPKKNCSNLVD